MTPFYSFPKRKAHWPKLGKSLKIGMQTFSKKEKNIISLLFMLSLAFLTNIPMAVLQIRKAFGSKLADFIVALANILELLFAASNFYLYCFCNSKIRTKVISETNQR